MAREKMVTRTIISTKCVVLALDTETVEPSNLTVEVSGTFQNEEKLMKSVKAVAETDTLKIVQILTTETVEKLYGVSEQKFMEIAHELEPRKKKEEE